MADHIQIAFPSGDVAQIDRQDIDLFSSRNWRILRSKNGKRRYLTSHHTYFHRVVVDAPKGTDVDHINGDGIDNRRANLRLGTRSQNVSNAGPRKGRRFKGTYANKKRFQAQINRRYIGNFATEEEAARAYDAAARVEHGEFAKLNFPDV